MVSKRGSKIALKIDTEKVKCLAFCWLKFCQKKLPKMLTKWLKNGWHNAQSYG
jgi:hypothetical protein